MNDFNAAFNAENLIPMNAEENRGMKIASDMMNRVVSSMNIAISNKGIDKCFNAFNKEAAHDYEMMRDGKGKDLAAFLLYLKKTRFISYLPIKQHMAKDFSSKDLEKGLDTAAYFGIGLFRSIKRTEFINDVVESCRKYNADSNDKRRMTRIFEYYTFADRAQRKYADDDIYNGLRDKCISAFNAITSQGCQKVVLKYVGKEFLKAK